MRRTIQRNCLCHIDNCTFRSTVAREIARADQSEDTCDVDYPATIAIGVWILAEHLSRGELASEKDALRVYLLDVVP